ncbi:MULTISPECIES: FHA domain-containing protein [Collinsella]|uniref:FHA domain-containing protein n=1 Tax=Collinsella TaxID=102106 RepID=UPI000B3AFEB7|nr:MULTISPECIES: FHA domain-containing protein [Collinsella]MBM6682944.1 FHA domain-containing protein [Collinsella intestinalis]OUN47245.1 FHA domain-containing protein [Collinsella sp. An7]
MAASSDFLQDGVPSTEQTRVFRMPADDATAPDLMKSVSLSRPVLTIIKGPQTGNTFELDDVETTVGRDPANAIFLNDMTVSRAHAKILRRPTGTVIEDLGSLNGTWVDGAIVNSAPLHDGSSVQIGTFTLIYHESKPERIETGE